MRRGRSVGERVIAVLGIVLLLVCTPNPHVKGETWEGIWERLPANAREQFRIGDGGNQPFAYVMLYWLTPQIMAGARGISEDDAAAYYSAAHNALGGREVIWVSVSPLRTGYFWPRDLSFVQGTTQFAVEFTDYAKVSGPFSGQLIAGTVTAGLVAIPAGVDITKPFLVYYDAEMKGEMGPFTSGIELAPLPSSVLSLPPPAAETVVIPAGSFQMGDSFGEELYALPVHTVYVSAFSIDKYEATKALWDEVGIWAAANGYDIGPADGDGKAPDHPVFNVSWNEAVKWANARSEKEGLTPCYTVGESVYRGGDSDSPNCNWSANGYRLPTEAEWEKAARGGAAGHRFPWSDTDTIQPARANYVSSSGLSYDTSPWSGYHFDYDNSPLPYTSPVGSFAPNGYGLYDMAGNAMEWCWDRYGGDYYASSPGSDPRGPASGSCRVFRGGSWYYSADNCCVAHRPTCARPVIWNYALGFRLVRTAP